MVTLSPPHYRVVGLTGGIGCGKSAAAAFFAEFGVPVVDADEISHRLTVANGRAMPAIAAAFGDDFVDADGAMHRQKMRDRVFKDPSAKVVLEGIIHPLVVEETDQAVAAAMSSEPPAGYLLLAVPLLFERMTFRGRLWRTLAVDCTTALQRERVQRRSGWSLAEVDRVIASQVSRAVRLQLADDVIVNTADLAALRVAVGACHMRYSTAAPN